MKNPGPTVYCRHARGLLVLFGCCLMGLAVGAASVQAADLVPAGATWKYLDDGSDMGTEWRDPGFIDTLWASGPAELGYGDGDEATTVSYGTDPDLKHVTTYFRHAFDVADPGSVDLLNLGLVRDDGATVYLNGTEIFRSNLPPGTITYTTIAPNTISGAGESAWNWFPVDPGLLESGTNVLAVEIHQRSQTSSDISFNLQLNDDPPPMLQRGPYLQMGTPEAVTVRWRTRVGNNSRVAYGLSPTSLNQVVEDLTDTTEHELRLTGLQPATTYYYSVGTTSETWAGGDADHFFKTSPEAYTDPPFRAWILGDCGTADHNAAAVRDAYYAYTGSTHTDLWLMLGDNAYFTGTDEEYTAAVFNMYPEMLRRSVLWSTRGNHEVSEQVYYSQFTFPRAGEAGGLPSGSEAYYSFEYANVHFVCLDSSNTSMDPGSPMLTWLESDLAVTAQPWIIAFWHHPPYSKGSHDSDDIGNSGGLLVEARENMLPILEAGGVDLVFCGHSHCYERSFLLDGHYGYSDTLDPAMILDNGDGRIDGTGAYSKTTSPNQGAVYCVAGSSGKISGGPLDHPAMFISLNTLGSVVLDVNGTQLDVQFLNSTGVVDDYYTVYTEVAPMDTVGATYSCIPGSGTLPFTTAMWITLENRYGGIQRQIAASIDVNLAGGQHYSGWRQGYTNVAAGDQFASNWNQQIPAIGSLLGDNTFTLLAEDVTPSPYNQPPYPPAGDTATAGCVVTGVAP